MCLLIEEMVFQELLQAAKQEICQMAPLQRDHLHLVELVTILIHLPIVDQERYQILQQSQLELKTDLDHL